MDVLVLIDKLDDLVHNAKAVPLTDQVRIDREEIYDILDQMRATIAETAPEEIPELEIPHEVVRRPPLAHAGVASRVVFFSLGIVGEHGIGFGEFAEFDRRIWISALIRMVLQRQLSVGMLNLIASRSSIHPKHFIIVSLAGDSWHSLLTPLA